MNKVHVRLVDYAGRDFGGEFEATSVSLKDGKVLIDLEYCGSKATKRLSLAALSIDLSILDRLVKPG